ncbi:MAG: DUF1289 domain-containing protein [Psychrobium sp.]|nr:DUF1289 domain-containing protein [Psychrobium sp.]
MTEEIRDQLQLFEVESPCVGICEVNVKGYCKGCFRSRDERFHWLKFSNGDKSKVLKLCTRRRRRKERDQNQRQNKGDDMVVSPPKNLPLF